MSDLSVREQRSAVAIQQGPVRQRLDGRQVVGARLVAIRRRTGRSAGSSADEVLEREPDAISLGNRSD